MTIRYRKTDQGVEFFFDYQKDVDAFVRFVELMQEPIRDPDGDTATKRLLEIRDWAGARDPYGATAAGFLVRLFRHEIDKRIYYGPSATADNAQYLRDRQRESRGFEL